MSATEALPAPAIEEVFDFKALSDEIQRLYPDNPDASYEDRLAAYHARWKELRKRLGIEK